MRAYAEYYLTCECGENLRSIQPELTCPKCGRQIVIRWRAEYQPGSAEEKRLSR